MAIQIGQQLGSLEVTALLGKGGMGEVYRARDTRLKREVAIKILPEEFSRDADRASRFQREAEVLGSLNHPNIAAIYDVQEANSTRYLVLELVEGETLADRIQRGPIPIEEALDIAKGICEGLEAAHEKGIIHRDLKPANVKITPAGKVKVLDFGLAKAMENSPADATVSNSPTRLSGTMGGVLLGTAAYMSPEQAKGLPVDKRADIWAFGAVLYEMLSGQRAFGGDTTTDILAAILRSEPERNALPNGTPPHIRELLWRCLEKDVKRRLRDIGDARWLLERPAEVDVTPQPRRRVWVAWAITSIFAALAVIGWLRSQSSNKTDTRRMTLTIVPPEGTALPAVGGLGSTPEISPDGLSVFYSARGLSVRRLDSLQPEFIRGSQAISNAAFWSADSKSVAVPTVSGLMKIRIPDGAPEMIGGLPGYSRGGTWSDKGTILISTAVAGTLRLYAAPPGAGELKPVDVAELKPGEYLYPEFLPGTEDFLFFLLRNDPSIETEGGEVYLATLRDGKAVQPSLLMRNETAVRYTAAGGGRVLFVRNDNLYSRKLNPTTRKLEGESELIQDGLASGLGTVNRADFSVSRSGAVAWRPGKAALSQVTVFDRQGTEVGKAGPPSAVDSISLAPDERRLLAYGGDHTWLLDSGQPGRLSVGTWGWFLWSPDGSRLLGQNRKGQLGERSVDGPGDVHDLGDAPGNLEDISPDGKDILLTGSDGTGIVSVPLEDTAQQRTPRVVIQKGERVRLGGFSPDGRWIIYSLRERGAGTNSEIFVQAYSGPGLRKQVTGSGVLPVWRKDGKEIVYLDGTNALTVWSVRVESAGDGLRFSAPEKLFSGIRVPAGLTGASRPLAVSHDGSRIYFPQAVEQPHSDFIHVKLGWFSPGETKR
jgi:serine/threonine protein kinase